MTSRKKEKNMAGELDASDPYDVALLHEILLRRRRTIADKSVFTDML